MEMVKVSSWTTMSNVLRPFWPAGASLAEAQTMGDAGILSLVIGPRTAYIRAQPTLPQSVVTSNLLAQEGVR